MVSELQTVVVEHPDSRPLCTRLQIRRSARPRALEVAVLDQRDFRRAFFIPARRSVRPMVDESCSAIEQENVRIGQTLVGSAVSAATMTGWCLVHWCRRWFGGGPASQAWRQLGQRWGL